MQNALVSNVCEVIILANSMQLGVEIYQGCARLVEERIHSNSSQEPLSLSPNCQDPQLQHELHTTSR